MHAGGRDAGQGEVARVAGGVGQGAADRGVGGRWRVVVDSGGHGGGADGRGRQELW